jgi:hypothetical protein
VHVFRASGCRGEPRESDEASPFWVSVAEIPFDRMWADDRHWFPLLLRGESFDGRFTFDGDVLLDFELHRHLSPTQHNVESGEDQCDLLRSELPASFGEDGPVKGNHLCNQGYGVFGEPGHPGCQQDVPRGVGPLQVAREGDAHHSGELASVERIPLHNHDRAAKSRL